MNSMNRADGEGQDRALDPVLVQALRSFRSCVHAWSEAELSRPRAVAEMRAAPARSWRRAAGLAFAIALATAGISGGVYEHRQRLALERDRVAKQHLAEQQRLVAAQQAREDEEDLLAKVDSDVSREVPAAMEPLAQLMAEDEAR
jgi:hypothetical protein